MVRGKKYLAARELVEKGKVYSLDEACQLVKKTSSSKFNATVEIAFNLNINPTQAEQQLRGTVSLPNGTGKTKKILVITNTKHDEAVQAGADFVGFKDMIEKIQVKNWFEFDVIIATPDAMVELSKIGKILGPKKLMPNPKNGTVTMDVAKAVGELKGGKVVDYRNDKQGNLHIIVGQVSFAEDQLAANIKAVIDNVVRIRPSTVKGNYIKSIHICSTMGPSIRISAEN